jgi:peptidylprolyl isomerase
MKSKRSVFLFFVLVAVAFTSCNESDDVDTKWRDENLAAYDKIKTTEGWRALDTGDSASGVYYKVVKSGDGEVSPLQTSTVKLLIWGTYHEESVFLTGTRTTNIPITIGVDNQGLIPRGLSMALQNMVVGDEWEVCVPYYLGFGIGGTSNSTYGFAVQAYSTLIYTVELKEVTLYP